jgi:hypothetical protein
MNLRSYLKLSKDFINLSSSGDETLKRNLSLLCLELFVVLILKATVVPLNIGMFFLFQGYISVIFIIEALITSPMFPSIEDRHIFDPEPSQGHLFLPRGCGMKVPVDYNLLSLRPFAIWKPSDAFWTDEIEV